MKAKGRTAALPAAGYKPTPRMTPQGSPVVRFVPEDPGSAPANFDFSDLPVSPTLQVVLATGFSTRTRTGGPIRTLSSAARSFRILRTFATYLGTLNRPPQGPGELTPAHLKGWLLQRQHHADDGLSVLKALLRPVPGISTDFAACLAERSPARERFRTASYRRSEFTLILNTARGKVRQAAELSPTTPPT